MKAMFDNVVYNTQRCLLVKSAYSSLRIKNNKEPSHEYFITLSNIASMSAET